WPNVSSRPMFGMTAVYRGKAIFGVLPRTRAMATPYSVSFKILLRNPSLKKRLEADLRILPIARDAKWISFELQSGDDLPDAIRWLAQAYRLTAKAGETRESESAALKFRVRASKGSGSRSKRAERLLPGLY